MREPVETTYALDKPWKRRVRRLVVGSAAKAGLRVEPLDDSDAFADDDSTKLPEMLARFVEIPGMLTLRRCTYLYLMAYANSVPGDIVEIGSWQGRSTAFLAQACEDTDNGVVHAIDHFAGNPGTSHYSVDGQMETLEDNFRRNIERAGLTHRVVLHSNTSAGAAPEVAAAVNGVRLLFIDGEHSYDAVREDLANYADLVSPGGMLVFDDYSRTWEGDVRAVREHVEAHPGRYARGFQYRNTLALRRVK
jgi:predicted O-methyltransferase YrrM